MPNSEEIRRRHSEEIRRRLVKVVGEGGEEAMFDHLALLQEHTAQQNALSAPIIRGISLFLCRHPEMRERLVAALADTTPNTIIGTVAYGYRKAGKGTAEECVEYAMNAEDNTTERVYDALVEIVELAREEADDA